MPEFFIPARNSRHRIACFALYRALIRQAAKVPLPDKLRVPTEGPEAEPIPIAEAPIRAAIRRSFRLNRQDTSPRLVLRSLENGYKFLDLLSEAQTPSSAAHKSILAFLEDHAEHFAAANQEAADDRHAARQRQKVSGMIRSGNKKTRARSTQPSAPREDTVPLLTRRPIPDSGGQSHNHRFMYYYYEYAPTDRPLPLEAIQKMSKDGRRRVPTFATETMGIPFLRLRKPQSPVLSRVLRQKGNKRRERMMLSSELQYHEVDFVTQEDNWERVVHEQLVVDENDEARGGYNVPDYDAASYAHSVWVGITYLNNKLNTEAADMMARAKALMQIVNEEKALAEKEEKERQKKQQALLEWPEEAATKEQGRSSDAAAAEPIKATPAP